MEKEYINSTCGLFIAGKIDKPCCSACPACSCHKDKNKELKDKLMYAILPALVDLECHKTDVSSVFYLIFHLAEDLITPPSSPNQSKGLKMK